MDLDTQNKEGFLQNKKQISRSLFELNNELAYILGDYFTEMLYARQVSAGQTAYKETQMQIVDIFENKKRLKSDTMTYESIESFVNTILKPNGGVESFYEEVN